MNYILVALASWFLIGGVISLLKKVPAFFKVAIVEGQIVDWVKNGGQLGLASYTPIVEFLDKEKNELVKKSLGKDSMSGLFFRRKVKIWIVVDQQGNIQALVSSLMELIFPIALVVLGIILLSHLF